MKLQERIDQTDLGMTDIQVKAFFLGILSADKPMTFPKALDELLEETPEAKKELEADLKKLWDSLVANKKKELNAFFPEEKDTTIFLEVAKDQLDYFLTAMSLSGTNTESCKDEAVVELIEELENTIEDLDEFLSDSEATSQDGADFKEFLEGLWSEFVETRP